MRELATGASDPFLTLFLFIYFTLSTHWINCINKSWNRNRGILAPGWYSNWFCHIPALCLKTLRLFPPYISISTPPTLPPPRSLLPPQHLPGILQKKIVCHLLWFMHFHFQAYSECVHHVGFWRDMIWRKALLMDPGQIWQSYMKFCQRGGSFGESVETARLRII